MCIRLCSCWPLYFRSSDSTSSSPGDFCSFFFIFPLIRFLWDFLLYALALWYPSLVVLYPMYLPRNFFKVNFPNLPVFLWFEFCFFLKKYISWVVGLGLLVLSYCKFVLFYDFCYLALFPLDFCTSNGSFSPWTFDILASFFCYLASLHLLSNQSSCCFFLWFSSQNFCGCFLYTLFHFFPDFFLVFIYFQYDVCRTGNIFANEPPLVEGKLFDSICP